MTLSKIDNDWIPLQIKVFTRWVSNQLKDQKDIEVNNVCTDLSNGVALVDLAQILTHKKASHSWAEHPKRNVDMVQNCDLALEMFANDGVHLVGISGKDINDSNQKLILGLIWTLILHYSIGSLNEIHGKSKINSISNQQIKSNQDSLLLWAKERTENYPHIHNFTPFDLSMCALLDSYFPEKIHYYSLDQSNSANNLQLAISVLSNLGVPIFVYPDELEKNKNVVDEKTLLTQLAALKSVLDTMPICKDQSTPVEKNDSSYHEEISHFEADLLKAQAELDSEKQSRQEAEAKIEEEKAKSTDEINKLTNLLHDYELRIDALQKDKEKDQAEIKLEKGSKQKSDEEVERLAKSLKDAEAEIIDLRQSLNKSIEQNENQKKSISQSAEEVQKLTVDLNDAKIELTKLKGDKTNEREIKRLTESLQNAQNEIQSLKSSNHTLQGKVSKLVDDKEQSKNEIQKLNQKYQIEAEEVFSLKTANEVASSDIEEYKLIINKLTSENEHLVKEICEIKSNLTGVLNEKSVAESKLNAVTQNLINAEQGLKEHAMLKSEIDKLSKSIDDSEARAEAANWEKTKYQNQLKDAFKEIAKLRKQTESLSEDKLQMENEIDRLSRSIVETEAQLALEKANGEKLSNKVKEIEREKLTTEKLLSEVKKANKDMVSQLTQNKIIISTAASNSLKLQRENDLLSTALADANGQIQEFQTARDLTLEELNTLSEGFKASQEENDELINENTAQKLVISVLKQKEIESEKEFQSLNKQLEREVESNTIVVKQLGAAITHLHAENDLNRMVIKDLNSQLSNKLEEIERLNGIEWQLEDAKAQLQKQSVARENAEEKVLELSDALSIEHHKVDSLSNDLQDAIMELRIAERSRGTAAIEAQTLANALYDAYGQMQSISDNQANSEELEYELEGELAKSQNIVEALKQSRIDAEKEIILLEKQLNDEERKISDADNYIAKLENENEVYKSRESQLKEALAVSEIDHEKMRRRVLDLEQKSAELAALLLIMDQDLEKQKSLKCVSQLNEEKLAKSLVEMQFELQDMKMENETLLNDHNDLLTEYDELRDALNEERLLREKVENDAKEFAKIIAQLDLKNRQYKQEKDQAVENAEEMARELVKSQVDVVTLKKENEELEETGDQMARDLIIADAKLADSKKELDQNQK